MREEQRVRSCVRERIICQNLNNFFNWIFLRLWIYLKINVFSRFLSESFIG
ncbi:MAG: hypothetical protein MRECE_50c004 [Mycoplasmataceae bacterium CE_OT135]|nr:MAG: hypothetical protein MRECE_50c004 [Mycoplasmataceae bacterium CE_OT135]